MNYIESIEDFYNLPQNIHLLELGEYAINKDFNVFRRWDDCKSVRSYFRRDFYRIVLTLSKGILTYPDYRIKVEEPSIFIANKITPYSWEALEYEQKGWVCLFTSEFLDTNYNYNLNQIFLVLGTSMFLKVIDNALLQYLSKEKFL